VLFVFHLVVFFFIIFFFFVGQFIGYL